MYMASINYIRLDSKYGVNIICYPTPNTSRTTQYNTISVLSIKYFGFCEVFG